MKKDSFKLRLIKKIARFIYPRHNFKDHIMLTVEIARMLALRSNVDLLTVEAAAYLHDVGRIFFGYKHHGYTGSVIAKIILSLLGFDKKRIESVRYCILVHDRNNGKRDSLEAEIIANADALSQIDNFLYLFSIYYSSHGRDTLATKKWIKEKYDRGLEKKITLTVAKKMASEKIQIIDKILRWPDMTNSGLNF